MGQSNVVILVKEENSYNSPTYDYHIYLFFFITTTSFLLTSFDRGTVPGSLPGTLSTK